MVITATPSDYMLGQTPPGEPDLGMYVIDESALRVRHKLPEVVRRTLRRILGYSDKNDA